MKTLITCLMTLCFSATAAFAAPVDIPTVLKPGYGQQEAGARINPWNDLASDFRWSMGLQADMVAERELEGSAREAEAMFYGAKFTLPLYLLGQWDWYADVGMAVDPQIRARFSGTPVKYELDNGFSWGAGTNYVFFNNTDSGWGLFTDIKYRAIEDTGYDKVTVAGAAAVIGASEDARWDEWQIALGVVKRWDNWMLYGGPKITETAIDADVTSGATRYAFNNARTDMMTGGFLGMSYQFNGTASVDVEGRMGDEMGYDAKVVFKF